MNAAPQPELTPLDRMPDASPCGVYSVPGTPLRLVVRTSGWCFDFDVLTESGAVDPYISADFRNEFRWEVLNRGTARRMGEWLQERWGFGTGQKAKMGT